MRRFLSNYIIMPGGAVHVNHIIEVDSNGRLASLAPADAELAYTTYVPHPILVLPRRQATKLTTRLKAEKGAYSVEQLTELSKPICHNPGDKITLLEIDTTRRSCSTIYPNHKAIHIN